MTKGKKKKKIPKPFHLPSTLTVTDRKHLRKVRKSIKKFHDEDESPYKIGRFIFYSGCRKRSGYNREPYAYVHVLQIASERKFTWNILYHPVSSLGCLLMIVHSISMLFKKDIYLFGRQIKTVVPQLAQKP